MSRNWGKVGAQQDATRIQNVQYRKFVADHFKERRFINFLSFFDFLPSSPWMLPAGLASPLRLPSFEDLGPSSFFEGDGIGIEEDEPDFLATRETLLAKRWKFCEAVRFLFGSEDGSGVPLRAGN